MDKDQKKQNRYGWIEAAMPLLPQHIRDARRKYGDAHVNECWKRGVVQGQPGWFFARQGTVALGAPFVDDAGLAGWAATHLQPDQVLLLLRTPEAGHGA